MTCEELRDDYELYAMGVSEEPARGELREHLQRGCDTCIEGVRKARTLTSKLSNAVALADPPFRLRRRVQAMVTPELLEKKSAGWSWLWAGAAALLGVATLFFAARESHLRNEFTRVQAEARQQKSELARLDESFSLLNDPDSRQIVFGQNTPKPPRGRIFVHRSRGVVFMASNLPFLEAGKTYEMWLIPKGGNPLPAGLFLSAGNGTAMYVRPGPLPDVALAAVAISVEPQAGSVLPTTQPIIVAAL